MKDKIIAKQDEIITLLYKACNKYEIGDWTKIGKVKDELAQLKAEAEKEATEIGFVRSGNCPDEIIWQGIEYVKKSSIIDYVCDACGCHPSVIINTPKGRFCQQHVQY